MEDGESMYCENDECAVLVYEVRSHNAVLQSNCPGCGQFGRAKGK